MIDELLARKFIDKIASYTSHNVNIINERGIIIAASRDSHRVGDFHEAAYRLLQRDESVFCISPDDDYLGVLPGVNMVISCKGKKMGVVGVTGNPDQIYDIALIIKMSLETMMEYESQHERIQERKNTKLHFMNLLLYEEGEDAGKQLPAMAQSLGYDSNRIRLPVLITFHSPIDTEQCLQLLKKAPGRHSQDISHITRSGQIILFKSFSLKPQELFAQYRELLEQYAGEFLTSLKEQIGESIPCDFFVGSFQKQLDSYRYGFKHCNWMRQHGFSSKNDLHSQTELPKNTSPGKCPNLFYFYDYVQEYLASQVPFLEIYQIYHTIAETFTPDFQNNLVETIQSLEHNNYNLNASSKHLFIHKNTLIFRFNKIKSFFHINPVQVPADRKFLSYFIYYLKNR